jgi:hypothetical protein
VAGAVAVVVGFDAAVGAEAVFEAACLGLFAGFFAALWAAGAAALWAAVVVAVVVLAGVVVAAGGGVVAVCVTGGAGVEPAGKGTAAGVAGTDADPLLLEPPISVSASSKSNTTRRTTITKRLVMPNGAVRARPDASLLDRGPRCPTRPAARL